jgi:hypothetical protein
VVAAAGVLLALGATPALAKAKPKHKPKGPVAVQQVCGRLASATWSPSVAKVYVVTCQSTIPKSTTLTLAAGTIVKLADNTQQDQYGNPTDGGGLSGTGTLVAKGTSSSPVTLTSLEDDSVGGDTNHDGAATSPSDGAWRGIAVNRLTLAHATVSYTSTLYGGATGATSSDLTKVTDSQFQHGSALVAHGAVDVERNVIDGGYAPWSTAAYAVLQAVGTTPTVRNNTIRNLLPYTNAISVSASAIDPNLLTGNLGEGALALAGTITKGATLPTTGLPWVIQNPSFDSGGSIVIAHGVTVTLPGGFSWGEGGGSFGYSAFGDGIYVQGKLVSVGTAQNPVVIALTVEVQPGGSAQLAGAKCLVEEAGPDPALVVDSGAGSATLHGDVAGTGGVVAKGGQSVDATNTWWGDPSGPSGDHSGSGAPAVGANVAVSPWLTSAP